MAHQISPFFTAQDYQQTSNNVGFSTGGSSICRSYGAHRPGVGGSRPSDCTVSIWLRLAKHSIRTCVNSIGHSNHHVSIELSWVSTCFNASKSSMSEDASLCRMSKPRLPSQHACFGNRGWCRNRSCNVSDFTFHNRVWTDSTPSHECTQNDRERKLVHLRRSRFTDRFTCRFA